MLTQTLACYSDILHQTLFPLLSQIPTCGFMVCLWLLYNSSSSPKWTIINKSRDLIPDHFFNSIHCMPVHANSPSIYFQLRWKTIIPQLAYKRNQKMQRLEHWEKPHYGQCQRLGPYLTCVSWSPVLMVSASGNNLCKKAERVQDMKSYPFTQLTVWLARNPN